MPGAATGPGWAVRVGPRSRPVLTAGQPFVLPALIPAMMCRWKTRNIRTMGMLAMTMAPISTVRGTFWESWTRATLIGCLSVFGEDHQGPEEVLPHGDEREDRDDAEHRPRQAAARGPERTELARAVDLGRLQHIARYLVEEPFEQVEVEGVRDGRQPMASGSLSRLTWISGMSTMVRYFGTTRAWTGTIRVARMPPRITLPKAALSLDRA
ncbi:hypothetical protein SMICM304S_01673 [Streptomyces microflavus]